MDSVAIQDSKKRKLQNVTRKNKQNLANTKEYCKKRVNIIGCRNPLQSLKLLLFLRLEFFSNQLTRIKLIAGSQVIDRSSLLIKYS